MYNDGLMLVEVLWSPYPHDVESRKVTEFQSYSYLELPSPSLVNNERVFLSPERTGLLVLWSTDQYFASISGDPADPTVIQSVVVNQDRKFRGLSVLASQAPQTSGHTSDMQAPAEDPSQGPTAQCNDGTYSYAAHHQGACSHHSGVAVWYR
jgi:hypothetical protein